MTDPGNNLPIFPEFIPLALNQRAQIEKIVSEFDPYSDYIFSNLWAWDLDGSTLVSTLHGNLVFRLTDYDKNIRFFTFIGRFKLNETVHSLLKYAANSGDEPTLMLVPEIVATALNDSSILAAEDRDSHDYILSVETLAAFRSNEFRGKRNLLNRFTANFGETATLQNTHLAQSNGEIIDFFSQWQHSRGKDNSDVEDELLALSRTLSASGSLNMSVLLLYIDGVLAGFTVYEVVHQETAVIHFDKALTEFTGIYEFMKNELAKILLAESIRFINYEPDLGIEGLRKAKESYHPIKFLKKYNVTLSKKD